MMQFLNERPANAGGAMHTRRSFRALRRDCRVLCRRSAILPGGAAPEQARQRRSSALCPGA